MKIATSPGHAIDCGRFRQWLDPVEDLPQPVAEVVRLLNDPRPPAPQDPPDIRVAADRLRVLVEKRAAAGVLPASTPSASLASTVPHP